MKNNIIKKLWGEFSNDEKYKKYLLRKDDLWNYKLDNLKKYIDTTGKRPNEESKDIEVRALGKWAGQNVYYFQRGIGINGCIKKRYTPNSRKKLWQEFINDTKYKHHFMTLEEEWIFKLNKTKQYIDDNEDKPTYYKCKSKEDKELGKWLDHQISNSKTDMKMFSGDSKIKEQWNQFINDEKYKIYFISQEEQWIVKLKNCKDFIKENKRRPNTKSEIKEERTMGYWITNQIKNYKNKCEILGESESLQKIWITFISDIKKLKGLTLDDKIQIIREYDRGIICRTLASQHGVSPATISHIIKDRVKYESMKV